MRGRRSLDPLSDDALNKKISSRIIRQKKKVDAKVQCLENIITFDAHPVVRDVVESKILSLVDPKNACSPRLELGTRSPMPLNGFAERAIRTPPDMQRRMDLFRERINMHRVPTDQIISPTLIPTQDFLINTTKKAIPSNQQIDPLLAMLMEEDHVYEATSRESSADEPEPRPKRRKTISHSSDFSEIADTYDPVSNFDFSINDHVDLRKGDESTSRALRQRSVQKSKGKTRSKKLFGDSCKENYSAKTNKRKQKQKTGSPEKMNIDNIPETNEFSFINQLNERDSQNQDTVALSNQIVPDSLEFVHNLNKMTCESESQLSSQSRECEQTDEVISQHEEVNAIDSQSTSETQSQTGKENEPTKKQHPPRGKKRIAKPNMLMSQKLFTPSKMDSFDVFADCKRRQLPVEAKMLIKTTPKVTRLSRLNCSQLQSDSNAVSQTSCQQPDVHVQVSEYNEQPIVEVNEEVFLSHPVVFLNSAGMQMDDDMQMDQEQDDEDTSGKSFDSAEEMHYTPEESQETAENCQETQAIYDIEEGAEVEDNFTPNKRVTRSRSNEVVNRLRSTRNVIPDPENVREKMKKRVVTKPRRKAAVNKRNDANKTMCNYPVGDFNSKNHHEKSSARVEASKAASQASSNFYTAPETSSYNMELNELEFLPEAPCKNAKQTHVKNEIRTAPLFTVRASIDAYSMEKKGSRRVKRKLSKIESGQTESSGANSAVRGICGNMSIYSTSLSPKQQKTLKEALKTLCDETSPPEERKNKPGLKVAPKRRRGGVASELGLYEVTNDVSRSLEGVTHLVCGDESKRTLSVLFAIARGCWLLTFDWVEKSLSEGKWLRERDFEVTTFPGAKVNRERLSLLKLQALHQSNIAYHLSSASIIVKPPKILSCNCLLHVLDGTQPPKHELMALITLSGGWLVDNPEHAKYLIGQRNGQNLTAKRLDRRMNLFNVPVVKETWILDSIASGHQKNFEDYIVK